MAVRPAVNRKRMLGILVLVVAAVNTATTCLNEASTSLTDYMVIWVGLGIAVVLIHFWLWRFSRETPGERMMLSAFLASAAAALFNNLYLIMIEAPMAATAVVLVAGFAAGLLAPMFLGAGLLRSRVVPAPVGWLALAWGGAGLFNLVSFVSDVTLGTVVEWLARATLWALGVGLVMQRDVAAPEQQCA